MPRTHQVSNSRISTYHLSPFSNLHVHPMITHSYKEFYVRISKCSCVYREIMAERNQVEVHKWLESEKSGKDIGYEKALMSWVRNHRNQWLKFRRRRLLGID